jgi:hypothetical protein
MAYDFWKEFKKCEKFTKQAEDELRVIRKAYLRF